MIQKVMLGVHTLVEDHEGRGAGPMLQFVGHADRSVFEIVLAHGLTFEAREGDRDLGKLAAEPAFVEIVEGSAKRVVCLWAAHFFFFFFFSPKGSGNVQQTALYLL